MARPPDLRQPWHVSGEVRYGEAAALFRAVANGPLTISHVTLSATSAATGTDRETHGLADFAVGRDLGVGKDAVQFKVGIRVAEITANSNAFTSSIVNYSGIAPPIPTAGGGTTSSVQETTFYNNAIKGSFRGAGPRIGLEGTVPLRGGWAFDYLADSAALFGMQKSEQVVSSSASIVPPITVFVPVGPNFGPTVTQRATTVFNSDIQAGIGYWINPNLKVTASYRLDVFWGALLTFDSAGNSVKADRYYHGPHLTLTGDF